MRTNQANAPPGNGRHFYSIHENDDGLLDIYLRPDVMPIKTPDGFTDYDISVLVVRGVEPFDGIEDDIRERYHAWCDSAEMIYL